MVEKNQQQTNPNNKPITAMDWLRDSIRGINKTQKGKPGDYTDFLRDKERNVKRKLIGQVLLFAYKPTSRVKVYDRYPLVIVTGFSGSGFTGINLHYIPPSDRLKMVLLMSNMLYNQKENDPQKMRIRVLSLFNKKIFTKYYGTVFNNYSVANIMGKPKITTPEEWVNFAFLPVFKGINPAKLYSEILKEVNK